MDRVKREKTFEEEAVFYEKEAIAEFAKETGDGDCSEVNGILRRGMRIIRKARQEIANLEVVQCGDCKWGTSFGDFEDNWIRCTNLHGKPLFPNDGFCSYGERREGECL